MKKKLTQSEEFQILLLVLDKFLLLGFGIMAFGLYWMFFDTVTNGLMLIIAGAALLVLMMILIIKEYEVMR